MVFTATPVDGSGTPVPMSSAVPDGTNTPLAIEGGPSISTGGNNLTPVSMYVKDGNNLVEGVTTDTAVTGDNAGTVSAKLRGLSKMFFDVWDSVNHRLHVNIDNANANGQNTMVNSSPVVIASNQTPLLSTIEWNVRNATSYSATTGRIGSGAALNSVPVSFFLPVTSTKNAYLYSCSFYVGAAINAVATVVTTDANYATAMTALNNKIGGAAPVSGANITTTNAAIAITGTNYSGVANVANTTQDLFITGGGLALPAGVANGLVLWLNIGSSQPYQVTFKWIEY